MKVLKTHNLIEITNTNFSSIKLKLLVINKFTKFKIISFMSLIRCVHKVLKRYEKHLKENV